MNSPKKKPGGMQLLAGTEVRYQIKSYESFLTVSYQGSADALLRSGCVEDQMTRPGRAGSPRCDANGHEFRFRRCQHGQIRVTRKITKTVDALALPGVTEDDLSPVVLAIQKDPAKVVFEDSPQGLRKLHGLKAALAPLGLVDADLLTQPGWVDGLWIVAGMDEIVSLYLTPNHPVPSRIRELFSRHPGSRCFVRGERAIEYTTSGNLISPDWDKYRRPAEGRQHA